MKIITINREFGSGGRELAKRLAEHLGVAYYDKEIIEAIARKTSLALEYVKQISERSIATYPIHIGRTFSFFQQTTRNAIDIMVAQENVIRELAGRGDCVIVGRNADIILREQNPFNIFVYADMDYKLKRCHQKGELEKELSDKEMRKAILSIDNGRKKAYEFMSENKWGSREAYHLCVNTGKFEIKSIVPAIAQLSEIFFDTEIK